MRRKVIKRIAQSVLLMLIVFVCAQGVRSDTYFTNLDDYLNYVQEERGWDLPDVNGNSGNNNQTPADQNVQPSAPNTSTSKQVVKSCSHEYVDTVTKEATCSTEGEVESKCSKCGDTYKSVIPATGVHDYEITENIDATCETAGSITYKCKTCNETYTDEIPAKGHMYDLTVTKEPSCVVPGEQEYKCAVCGDTYKEEIAAKGHTAGEWQISVEPGMFTPGEKQQVCTECGEVLSTEEVPSQYPITYLYIGIGLCAAVILTIILVVLSKKKKHF